MNTDIYGESPALSFGVRDYGPYHVLNCYRGDTFKPIQRQACVQEEEIFSPSVSCAFIHCLGSLLTNSHLEATSFKGASLTLDDRGSTPPSCS